MGFLFYLFGIILVITANWGLLFKETSWYKAISDAIKL